MQSIMVRTAIDQDRRRQRENKVIAPQIEDFDSGAEAEVDASIGAQEIIQLIQLLPNMQRTVFNLFAIEGYSHKEISSELNITEGTSKWYLCEARKTLK